MKLGYGLKRVLACVAACIALAHCPALFAQQQWRWGEASRIVVIPDVHGAYSELVDLLEATGIVDASLAWSGGEARLVSLGDLLDRGPDSRKVLDLLMRLQRDAADGGGAVHVVLGNHEAMNLMGDLRYVSAEEYAAFVDEEPEHVREAAYRQFVLHRPSTLSDGEAREAFARSYPPGYFGHRLAFDADGLYGSWLLSLPSLIVIGKDAFVHGGLSDLVSSTPAGEINAAVQGTLRRYVQIRDQLAGVVGLPHADLLVDLDAARDDFAIPDDAAAERASAPLLQELVALADAPTLGINGPLWYRGSVYCSDLIERPVLDAALERLDAARVIVGHTPTENRRARALHGGRLVMLDTGMLTERYSGRPAALIIEGDRTAVQYLAPHERLPLESGRIEAYGLTEDEILVALTEGEVEQSGEFDAGLPTRFLVRHSDQLLGADFYTGEGGRAGEMELAAHALDRLLNLHMVPPTAAREINGQTGALQLSYPDAITEAERIERQLTLEEWCPIEPQLQLMRAFDVLTYNTGRARGNLLYRREHSTLKLVDHRRAFGTERRPRLEDFELPPELSAPLAALDSRNVEAALGEWLDGRQIRALLARRDTLIRRSLQND